MVSVQDPKSVKCSSPGCPHQLEEMIEVPHLSRIPLDWAPGPMNPGPVFPKCPRAFKMAGKVANQVTFANNVQYSRATAPRGGFFGRPRKRTRAIFSKRWEGKTACAHASAATDTLFRAGILPQLARGTDFVALPTAWGGFRNLPGRRPGPADSSYPGNV